MLEIAQHFGEILGPLFQLVTVADRQSHQLGGDGGGKNVGEFGHNIHSAIGQDGLDQPVCDLLDMLPELFHPCRSESCRRQCAEPGVRGRVHENHLSNHYLRDRVQLGKADCAQLLGRRRAARQEVLQHRDGICVSSDQPKVKIGVPVHWILRTKPPVTRIRIG